jgi:hypothetical protein
VKQRQSEAGLGIEWRAPLVRFSDSLMFSKHVWILLESDLEAIALYRRLPATAAGASSTEMDRTKSGNRHSNVSRETAPTPGMSFASTNRLWHRQASRFAAAVNDEPVPQVGGRTSHSPDYLPDVVSPIPSERPSVPRQYQSLALRPLWTHARTKRDFSGLV